MAKRQTAAAYFKELESQTSKVPAPTTVDYRALISWKDGVPFITGAPMRVSDNPHEIIPELLKRVLDLPYDGPDTSLAGLSNAEAIAVQISRAAACGDLFAAQMLFDRLLGRPKQSVESVTLTGNLNDFLDSVAENTKIDTVDVVANPVDNSVEDL